MPDSVSRRDFLARFAAAGAVVSASSVLAACGGGGAPTTAAACDGYATLTPEEIQARQTLQYVDNTTDPAKNCKNCIQYNWDSEGNGCGGCKLFAGPVLPNGYCAVWAPEPTA